MIEFIVIVLLFVATFALREIVDHLKHIRSILRRQELSLNQLRTELADDWDEEEDEA